MNANLLRALPAIAAAVVIAGCGGGNDDAQATQQSVQTTQLSGTAATGAPVAAGDVSVTCGTAAGATTTSASGTWGLSLQNATFPCVVAVSGGSMPAGLQLYGYATSATNVNVTPLTTLIGAYATSAANGGALTQALLDAASAQVLADLTAAGFSSLPSDPLSAAFTPATGDAHDDLIEALMLSLSQQGTTLNQLADDIAQDGTADSAELVTPSVTAFDSIADPFPANMPSYGPEAYALSSLGDRIRLAPDTPRKLRAVTVGMSSWACESGAWNTANCVSAAGTTFTHPVTLRIYDDSSNTLLATRSQEFVMPYRPSTDTAACADHRWKAADGVCYSGIAFKITFDLSSLKVTLPDNVRYELSYNTRSYGAQPLGETGPYDSLNMGIYNATVAHPSVGSDPDSGYLMWNGSAKDKGAGLMAQFQVGS